ncbi:GGDEF domain-containing protein, partial [Methylorubrum thiocyanatum]|uniref:GGDEF domain-containing protein n=1 Tax=Methylorubrum thiocyanatum TaxID=47958 RepID=UPI0035C7EB72
TDLLTGLPNRRRFEEAFEQAAKASRRADRPLALLVIDADHFKRYNDRHGHVVGDAVLKSLAKSLTESLRRPNDLAARVGGEEFAVLLPDTDRAGAARIAEAIHAAVADLAVPAAGIGPGSITVSIGLAVSAGDRETEDLYRRADAALYEAKESGRNRTCCAPGAAEEAPDRPPTRLTAAPQRRVAR